MSIHQCTVLWSTNPTKELTTCERNEDFYHMKEILKTHDIDFNIVDTIPGWWCLNQDWIEFSCIVNIEWGFCRPLFLSKEDWEWLLTKLQTNDIIMKVKYNEPFNKEWIT